MYDMNELTYNVVITIITSIFTSGLLTVLLQKYNEKESRVFNAQLDAYRIYIQKSLKVFDLLTYFESDKKTKENLYSKLNAVNLDAEGSGVLLTGSSTVSNQAIKLHRIIDSCMHDLRKMDELDKDKDKLQYEKIWKGVRKNAKEVGRLRKSIVIAMRKDLGFPKEYRLASNIKKLIELFKIIKHK